MKDNTKYILIFLMVLIFVALIVGGTIIMTHKELKAKPVLTKFMITQLPWAKQRAAEFLIEKEHLKVAPPLVGRKIVSLTEALQREKDMKQGIRNIEEETKEGSRKIKFDKIYRLLIKDYYNLRSVAKDRYLMADIKSSNIKYNTDENNKLSDVTVTVEYSFIPIQQTKDYNNDLPGRDVKDFQFKYDGENWLTVNMIDFS